MPLHEQLRGCLGSLTSHCEGLMAQVDALHSENQALRRRLEGTRPSHGKGAVRAWSAGSAATAADMPGWVSEDAFGWSAVLPQEKAVAPHGEAAFAAQGEHGWRLKVPQPPQPPQAQPRSDADSEQGEGHLATIVLDEGQRELRAQARDLVKQVSGSPDPKDQSLAAARLGMLRSNTRTAPDMTHGVITNTLSLFTDVMNDLEHLKTGRRLGYLKLFEVLVDSVAFKAICILAIAANTLYIGLEADFKVKNSYRRIHGTPKEPDWTQADIVFTTWFSLELVLRIVAHRRNFFLGADYRWNIFDCFLVVNSVVEIAFPFASRNFSFLRIFRVFRLVRIVRVVRTVSALKSLRTMVFALLNSFVCLMWAFVMILLIMFVFGIVFSNAVASFFDNLDPSSAAQVRSAEEVSEHFGNLYETMVSLLCSITGGDDWMVYGSKLRRLELGELYFALFYFYIVFCLVGMLNVVTGIFVDSAVCTRTEDEVVECFTEDQKRTSEEVRRIFTEADTDHSGTLSYEELASHLENPWVKAYFSGLDIDPSEAGIIFALIDTDGDNSISIDEFVDGTMKLKGHAKSIDVLSMMFDTVRFSHKFNQLCSYIEDELHLIRLAIAPDEVVEEASRRPSLEALQCPLPLAALNRISRIR